MSHSLSQDPPRGFATFLRLAAWGGAAGLLLLPAVAMQFEGSGVNWTASDFVVMGALLLACCGAFEIALRQSRNDPAYLLAACLAIGSGLMIVWINLAVGIIGSEDETANAAFVAVLGIGLIGAVLARLRASGLAVAMAVTAVAQAVVAAYALWLGSPEGMLLSLFLVATWVACAMLFRRAATR